MNFNFLNTYRLDTYKGHRFQILIDGSPLNLTGANIEMDVRQSVSNSTSHEFSTANGKIIIEPGVNGWFVFIEQVIDIPANNYVYDIKITLPNGKVHTYIYGTWAIKMPVTRT